MKTFVCWDKAQKIGMIVAGIVAGRILKLLGVACATYHLSHSPSPQQAGLLAVGGRGHLFWANVRLGGVRLSQGPGNNIAELSVQQGTWAVTGSTGWVSGRELICESSFAPGLFSGLTQALNTSSDSL